MFDIDSSDFFIPEPQHLSPEDTLLKKLLNFKPSTTTRLRSDFLSSRAVDHWNK